MNIRGEKDISNDFWQHIEQRKDKFKIAKRIYTWLDRDNLGAIILDKGVFWFELVNSFSTMPNYVYEYLKRWGKKQGYIYLYDLKKQF